MGAFYYVTKDDAGQKIQTEFGFQVEDGNVTGKRSTED